jgi:hypothetical protein
MQQSYLARVDGALVTEFMPCTSCRNESTLSSAQNNVTITTQRVIT